MNGTSAPSVTFLIPTLNSATTVGRCIESIFGQDYPAERVAVWVLDGYSTDNTVQIVSRFPVRVVKLAGNPAVAYNSVLGEVESDLVALVDSDAYLSSDWLAILVRTIEAIHVAAAGSLIGTWPTKSLWARAVGLELENRYEKLPRRVERIATTCMIVRTEVLRTIGGFDARLPTGYDVALGYDLRRLGGQIVFEPHAKVFHSHRETPLAYAKQQLVYGRSAVRLVLKWPASFGGDSVTPLGMTVQPILAFMLLAGGLLVALLDATSHSPLAFVPAVISLVSSFVLVLIWMSQVAEVAVKRKDSLAVMLIPLQIVRAFSWLIGIFAGLGDLLVQKDAPRQNST